LNETIKSLLLIENCDIDAGLVKSNENSTNDIDSDFHEPKFEMIDPDDTMKGDLGDSDVVQIENSPKASSNSDVQSQTNSSSDVCIVDHQKDENSSLHHLDEELVIEDKEEIDERSTRSHHDNDDGRIENQNSEIVEDKSIVIDDESDIQESEYQTFSTSQVRPKLSEDNGHEAAVMSGDLEKVRNVPRPSCPKDEENAIDSQVGSKLSKDHGHEDAPISGFLEKVHNVPRPSCSKDDEIVIDTEEEKTADGIGEQSVKANTIQPNIPSHEISSSDDEVIYKSRYLSRKSTEEVEAHLLNVRNECLRLEYSKTKTASESSNFVDDESSDNEDEKTSSQNKCPNEAFQTEYARNRPKRDKRFSKLSDIDKAKLKNLPSKKQEELIEKKKKRDMKQVKKKERKANNGVCLGNNQLETDFPSNNDCDSTASPDCFLVERRKNEYPKLKNTLMPTNPRVIETKLKKKKYNIGQVIDIEDLYDNDVM